MHRSFLRLALALCAATLLQPLDAAAREVLAVQALPQGLELRTAEGRYLFRPYSERVMETRFIPEGAAEPGPSHAIDPAFQPGAVPATLQQQADEVVYATPGIAVAIRRAPLRIEYRYKGRPLLAERTGFRLEEGRQRVDFEIDATEALYGGGARALGMNRRGHKLRLYNRAHYGYEERSSLMSYTMPLVLSSKRYMLHFDDPGTGHLDLDSTQTNTLAYDTVGQRRTYQVIAGERWEELMDSWTALTGRQPLPPRWAFGNFASRFGYRNEAQARDTVARFREAGIPLDAIVFDLYWFGKDITGHMGNLAFDREAFPTPEKMMADFAARGIKTVLVTEPFVLTTSKRWQEAVDRKVLATRADGLPATYDFYFGNTGLIDLFKPEARAWFWDIYKGLRAAGVSGWWGDLGEPEVHPSWVQHASGEADQVHNIYGHAWAGLIADGYRREFPQERPFILMRSGYSGSQRHGMIPWSGDVRRTWGGLRSQPEIALQMGMQGLAYMHSDLGGFAEPLLDDELYVRWLQYGVFQPIFRPHAQEEVPSEPVYRTPQTMALAREAIRLRYRMLPYNYTLAFDNSRTGMPLMRPLMFEDERPELAATTDLYFWGREFLVAPVLAKGQIEREVLFPSGGAFFDFHTGQRHAGGSRIRVPLQPDRIPVFVRAGAFVPLAPVFPNTDQYHTREIELHYYHDASVPQSQGRMYDDDGKTARAYEQGRYELLHFASRQRNGRLAIEMRSETGAHYSAPARRITLLVHGLQRKPQALVSGARKLPFEWDARRKLLRCSVHTRPAQTQRLQLRL